MKFFLPLFLVAASLSEAAVVVDSKIWFSSADGDDNTSPYPVLGLNVGAYDPSAIDGLVRTDPGFAGWGGGSITISLSELETVTSVTMTAVGVTYPFTSNPSAPYQQTVSLYSGNASDTGAGIVTFDFGKVGPAGERHLYMWTFGESGEPYGPPFTVTYSFKVETSAGTFLHDNGGNGWTTYYAVPESSSWASVALAGFLMAGRRRR